MTHARRALAVTLLLLCGCPQRFVAQRPYPPLPAEVLMEALRKRQAAVHAVDLDTRTTSWLGGDRQRATVVMLVERSGRLRFEVEVSIEGVVATLVTDGHDFQLSDLKARVFKHGPVCPENLGAYFPVPLMPAEIAAILLGDAPVGAEARPLGVSWDGAARAEVLEIANGRAGAAGKLWVSLRRADKADRWDVVAVAGESPGRPGRWRVEYQDLEAKDGVAQPGVVRFAEPGKSFDDGVEIKVRTRSANPALKDQAFALAPPAGFADETVPCCPGCPEKRP
jgi:hypothetical protein